MNLITICVTENIKKFKEDLMKIKLIPCFRVKQDLMKNIEHEVRQIIKENDSSSVAQSNHVTNWTKPYGDAIQYSLFNTTGNTLDFSTDHNLSQMDNNGEKMKFFFNKNFKNIYEIFQMFENGIMNLRINGMGKNSGLTPHKEYNIHDGRFRIRFHLPVLTSNKAWVMLNGEKFRLQKGIIYFFNNGQIHSAGNEGDEIRYHLVWDVWLDDKLYENFLDVPNLLNPNPDLLIRLSEEESSQLIKSEPFELTTYEDQLEGTKHIEN